MRRPFLKCLAFFTLITACTGTAAVAGDMRVMSIREQEARSELLLKATKRDVPAIRCLVKTVQ